MGPTVMLAIWERSLLNGISTKLRKHNFDVFNAEKEQMFVDQAADHDVDVILLDIRTNGETRLRLMAEAKENKPEIEIILLSNQHCLALAMEGIQAGAFDDLPEPFDVAEITRKIRAAWKRKKKKAIGRSRLAGKEKKRNETTE